ncbi:UDP-glucose 4-epimerase GalE [Veillonella sp. R32]|uniref:UDP-glucose 4-epimerase GalE n=1 Tax=Veillonella sp. R32 TaxID=2021312 RepID=UPI00138A315E|nr:UDP-glucose 4-epimerase GalE [Veillonella sp. R32]KAF1682873.1 UDP-glucose 4-epimerase GalE [Veillonella sp. R32]
MNILVTGGAGYIGSHTVRALQKAGHTPIVLDNLSRGHVESLPAGVEFINMDIADPALVKLLKEKQIDGVMHFAAHSQVGESMTNPMIYYENNVVGSFHLIESVRQAGVKYFVFSSTAAVYGEPEVVPIKEDARLAPTNVYGRTKLMIEQMLQDYSQIYGLRYVALRYFNAAGADSSGEIGEDHTPETHLIPLILEAALGKRPNITIFGTDYDTADGTCVRDYIHVNDLASAHILSMEYLRDGGASNYFNLGSGNGFSVKEIVDATKTVTGVDFPVAIGERRAGDPGTLIASSEKAQTVLGWKPVHSDVTQVIKDAWQWHQGHPNGYKA